VIINQNNIGRKLVTNKKDYPGRLRLFAHDFEGKIAQKVCFAFIFVYL
jgi:hypothetical protein